MKVKRQYTAFIVCDWLTEDDAPQWAVPKYIERRVVVNGEVIYRDKMDNDRYDKDNSALRVFETWAIYQKPPMYKNPSIPDVEERQNGRRDRCNFLYRFQMFWRKVFG